MKRLNQILAVEASIKKKREDEFTKVFQDVQKNELVTGFTKNYIPKDEEGEKLPPQNKRVQIRAQDALMTVKESLSELMDITATKDASNTQAKADVVVDGQVLLTGVPATHLLFLEKRLVSIIDLIKRLPVLTQDDLWKADPSQGLFVTDPQETNSTKKLVEYKVVVQPTVQHPAQVKETTQDVVVGRWVTTKLSGGLPPDQVRDLLTKAEKVQKAVKAARQEANETPAVSATSSQVLTYIFG